MAGPRLGAGRLTIVDPVGALPRGLARDALVAELRRALAPVAGGACVAVGASGGPDSAALLLLAVEARPDLDVVAVHVRHGLRPDDRDLSAFGAQVEAVSAPGRRVRARIVEVEVVEVGDGPEAAARVARHGALASVAREVGATAVLLGHTADDQAETVLLRLARGSGARGLAGMAPWRPFTPGVVLGRPLLRLRRSDVRGVAEAAGVPLAQDPTNTDPRFARSHLRATALPALDVHAGDAVGAMARAADLLREDADALAGWAVSVADTAVVAFGHVLSIPDVVLDDLPVAVRRRIVRHLADRCGVEVDAHAVGALLALESGQGWDAGGLTASRGGGWLALAPKAPPADAPAATLLPGPLGASTADVEVPGARPGRSTLVVDADLAARVEVRTRLPGDRIRTAGGLRSVQDLFVDAGVPRLARDLVPLLVDPARLPAESVVWVPGLDAAPDVVAAGRAAPAVSFRLASC